MPALTSRVNQQSEEYQTNLAHNAGLLKLLEEQLRLARDGGGAEYTKRHKDRGRLLARERVDEPRVGIGRVVWHQVQHDGDAPLPAVFNEAVHVGQRP